MEEKTGFKPKAVVLLSGGLDSTLAAKWLIEEGIEVIGLSFYTGFCSSCQKNKIKGEQKKSEAQKAANSLSIEYYERNIMPQLKKIIMNPHYGFGKNMNPCVDCRILMLKEAGKFMKENEYDFIATGEVLEQRPMSQNYYRLQTVSNESGYSDYILRPLSARQLKMTVPEKKGLVKRENLGTIQGRNRKKQMALIKKWNLTQGIEGGGSSCLLTDQNYSVKLKNHIENEKICHGNSPPILDNSVLYLFNIGRNFRIRTGMNIVVGRNQEDNDALFRFSKNKITIRPDGIPAPSIVFYGSAFNQENSIKLSEEKNTVNYLIKIKYQNEFNKWKNEHTSVTHILPENILLSDLFAGIQSIVSYSSKLPEKNIPLIMEIWDSHRKLTASYAMKTDRIMNKEEFKEFLLMKSNEKILSGNQL